MLQGGPCEPGCGRSAEGFCGTVVPAPTMRALRPAPRPTFSRRESRQRYAKGCAPWNPLVQGGRPFRARLRIAPGYFLPPTQTDLPLWVGGQIGLYFSSSYTGGTPSTVNPWRGRWVFSRMPRAFLPSTNTSRAQGEGIQGGPPPCAGGQDFFEV